MARVAGAAKGQTYRFRHPFFGSFFGWTKKEQYLNSLFHKNQVGLSFKGKSIEKA
ncbi:MAG: hypothetical protein ABR974_13045 [Bacteroidales bacterium]|jgi:hypothetical protein